MSTLLIGDVHGCFNELQALLKQVNFNPTEDTLWLTGDLVARGSDSLAVLRYIYSIRDSVRIVLGNHDLNLLATYAGITRKKKKDKLNKLFDAPDFTSLMDWLRRQPLMQVDEEKKLIMVHAGVTPQWDIETAKSCAKDVETVLSSNNYPLLLNAMYGDLPNLWTPTLAGLPRLRYITNAFTRMRFCYPNGALDMLCKESPKKAPSPLKPWFNLPSTISSEYAIVFGHWAALKGKGTPDNFYALDTGCCWGGDLTLLRWEDKSIFKQPSLVTSEKQ